MPSPSIAIIPCTSQKSETGGPAREVWVGSHFQLVLAYCEHFFDDVYIMSYKYGFISPDQHIEPYDIDIQLSAPQDKLKWWWKVKDDIKVLLEHDKPRIVALYTGQYERDRLIREFIKQGCPNVIVPWEGLGNGYRMQQVYDGEPPFSEEKLAAGEYALPEDFKYLKEPKKTTKSSGEVVEDESEIEWVE
jgi:hypothetical protein